MEISELTFKLIIFLIPGAIATRIYQKITIHEKWTSFHFIANSIIFGGISYILLWFFISLYDDIRLNNFLNNLPKTVIHPDLIIKACFIAILTGVFISALDNNKVLNRIATYLKISYKYGDEILFYKFLNSPEIKEIYIRDFENKTIYHGLIDSFNESSSTFEIALYDVAVYDNETGSELGLFDKIYLSRPKDKITIEIPLKTNNDEQTTETSTKTA